MFQTEPILFLQSFGHPAVVWFFSAVSELGYAGFYIPFFVLLLFGWRLKAGFVVMHAFLVTAVFEQFFKNAFALPRPDFVDANVLMPGRDYGGDTHFVGMGAESFFGALPQEVVNAYRLIGNSFGLPSGHVSGTTVAWSTTALMMRNRTVTVIATIMILLMPLSRMYLGRHFLADVLTGALLGGIMAWLTYVAVLREPARSSYLALRKYMPTPERRSIMIFGYLLVLPLLLTAVPMMSPDTLGYLFGINAGFSMLLIRGLPEDAGTTRQRLGRVAVALPIIASAYAGGQWVAEALVSDFGGLARFMPAALIGFLIIGVTPEICIKLKLYNRKTEESRI